MPSPTISMPTLLLLFLLPSPAFVSGAGKNASCLLDLSYVATFPWDHSPCSEPISNTTACCQTLLSVLGIGLAARLRATGNFRLPSAEVSSSCLDAFSSALSSPPLSLSSSLIPTCFPSSSQFAISPDYCAGILTAAEFNSTLGPAAVASLDSACVAGLNGLPRCSRCLAAGFAASSRLTAIARNASRATPCFYLTVLYAAGISNAAGPTNLSTANCILGLALSSRSSSNSNNSTAIYASTIPAAAAVAIALLLLIALFCRQRARDRNSKISKLGSSLSSEERRSHPRPNTGSILFGVDELAEATDGFADRNLVGRGGFGVVYRGVLGDGSVVAVKKMLNQDVESGDEEFTNEAEIISHLRHRNLVPLRGCCIADADADADVEEGRQRFLVYEFMPNGALEQWIFRDGNGRRTPLTWAQRRTVVLDVARGLAYLHYGVKPAIYHRDIKATNILLDGEMRARVADFGLARQSREGQSHLTTRVAGTHGYLAPEYALYGQLTEKSDVYSFGVLVLEVMSGRRALDMAAPSGIVLITDWAWTLVKGGRTREVLDERMLTGESPRAVTERFVLVGILCAHVMVALRPTIAEALRMLEGDMDIPEIPDRPLPFGHGVLYGEGGCTFSASPALSGPFMDTGDMLR